MYNVVSVDPIITEAKIPIKESTPLFFIISVAIAIEALPEIGLSNASGTTSPGKFKNVNIGVIILIIKSKIPELFNIPIETNNPTNVGNIFKLISTPSAAPFKKISKTFFLSFSASLIIIKITIGIAIIEI